MKKKAPLYAFSPEETLIILELARRCMADADLFDEVAGENDIADDVLTGLRDKLQVAMDDTDGIVQLQTRESGEALLLDGESCNDYILADGHPNCWIKVGSVAFNIANRGDHAIAEAFNLGGDFEAVVDECSADFPNTEK